MSARMRPGFEAALEGMSLATLEAHPATVLGLDRALRISYFNPAWLRFAAENEGEPAISTRWGLGASLMEAVPEVLRPFYQELFEQAGSSREYRLRPLMHEYECSSPTVYRRYVMAVYALKGGMLTIHSLVRSAPHGHSARSTDGDDYRDAQGVYHQCSHCRRFENLIAERWDWIPEWVAQMPPTTSHGLCPPCFEYYYVRGGEVH